MKVPSRRAKVEPSGRLQMPKVTPSNLAVLACAADDGLIGSGPRALGLAFGDPGRLGPSGAVPLPCRVYHWLPTSLMGRRLETREPNRGPATWGWRYKLYHYPLGTRFDSRPPRLQFGCSCVFARKIDAPITDMREVPTSIAARVALTARRAKHGSGGCPLRSNGHGSESGDSGSKRQGRAGLERKSA